LGEPDILTGKRASAQVQPRRVHRCRRRRDDRQAAASPAWRAPAPCISARTTLRIYW